PSDGGQPSPGRTCSPAPPASRSRSSCWRTLPLAVRGSSSSTTNDLGILYLANRFCRCSIIPASETSPPGSKVTAAQPTSPHLLSGTPKTAAAATPGTSSSTASTSAG